MARIQDVIGAPILGVSTLAQITRPTGTAQEQVNFRSNHYHGLSRRPRLEAERVLYRTDLAVKHFYYMRTEIEYHILVLQNGRVVIWKGDDMTDTGFLPTEYFNPAVHNVTDLIMEQINDTVFILNPKITISMDPYIKGYYNQPTHINVTTAMNYGDTLTLQVNRLSRTGELLYSKVVTHTVENPDYMNPDGIDFGPADIARSTAVIAEDITRQLNGAAWGGFLGQVSIVFSWIGSIANYMNLIGTNNGWPDYIAASNGFTASVDSITADITAVLDAMALLYGGGVASARAALQDAQATQAIKQGAYDKAVADLALNPGNSTLIAIRDAALVELDAAIAATVIAQAAYDAAAPTAEYNALWADFNSIINTDLLTLVTNIIVWGNMVISQGRGEITMEQLITIQNAFQAAQTMYAQGPVAFEVLSGGTFKAVQLGTNIDVYALGATTRDTVQVLITSGQGEKGIIIIHPVTNNIENMPKYAIAGSIVEINPDPQKATKGKGNGVYFMKAAQVNPVADGTMTEVIWQETVDPWLKNRLNRETMPHSVLIEPLIKYSWIEDVAWRERIKGDELTCPNPSFVGHQVTSIGYFQKRLVFLSGNNVVMSETDDIWNFFKASAIKLMVTDPVDISSSATGIDEIRHITTHNKDMLITSRNAQFKIPGNQPITPETVSMALTTKYDTQWKIKPVSAGNFVYFAINYGDSTGVFEYTAQPYTGQDVSGELTSGVMGYLKGECTLMAANPNLHFLACKTDGDTGNVFYVADRFNWKGAAWNSWSKWILSPSNNIINMYMSQYDLHVVVSNSHGAVIEQPPDLVYYPNLILHFDTFPPANAVPGGMYNITQTGYESQISTPGVFGSGQFIADQGSGHHATAVYLQANPTDHLMMGNDWTVRFIYTPTTQNIDMYTGVVSLGGIELVNHSNTSWILFNYEPEFSATVVPNVPCRISIERLGNTVYVYFDGVLKYTRPNVHLDWWAFQTPREAIFDIGHTGNDLPTFENRPMIDEFMYLDGTALAGGQGNYIVETAPFTYPLYIPQDAIGLDLGDTPVVVKKLSLFKNQLAGKERVHLDDMVVGYKKSSTTLAFPIDNYKVLDVPLWTCISGENCIKEFEKLNIVSVSTTSTEIIIEISTLEMASIIGTSGTLKVYLGVSYTSSYEPSIIYRKDIGDTNESLIRGKVRITNVYLTVSNSYEAKMTKSGLGITERIQTHRSTSLNSMDYRHTPNYTGNWAYYFKDDMHNANMVFWTNSHLQLTVNELSWEGQYHQVAKDLR